MKGFDIAVGFHLTLFQSWFDFPVLLSYAAEFYFSHSNIFMFLEKKSSVCILVEDISMVSKSELLWDCSLVGKSAQNLLPIVCFLSTVFCLIFPVPACTADNPFKDFPGWFLDYFVVNLLNQIYESPWSFQCCSWSQSRWSLLPFPCFTLLFSSSFHLCSVTGDEWSSQEHALRVVLHGIPQPGAGHLAVTLWSTPEN